MLAAATGRHRVLATSAAGGLAVDRHLFALYSLHSARAATTSAEKTEAEMPAIFADPAWTKLNETVLSTSNVNSPSLKVFSFGAVCAQGYGLAYSVTDDSITVQVSNFVSDPNTGGAGFGGVKAAAAAADAVATDAARFRVELEKALLDLQALFA
jgi:hypothetical protein